MWCVMQFSSDDLIIDIRSAWTDETEAKKETSREKKLAWLYSWLEKFESFFFLLFFDSHSSKLGVLLYICIHWLSVRPSHIMSIVINNDICIFFSMKTILFSSYVYACPCVRVNSRVQSLSVFVVCICACCNTHFVHWYTSYKFCRFLYERTTTHIHIRKFVFWHTFLFSIKIIWHKNIVSVLFLNSIYRMDIGQNDWLLIVSWRLLLWPFPFHPVEMCMILFLKEEWRWW